MIFMNLSYFIIIPYYMSDDMYVPHYIYIIYTHIVLKYYIYIYTQYLYVYTSLPPYTLLLTGFCGVEACRLGELVNLFIGNDKENIL